MENTRNVGLVLLICLGIISCTQYAHAYKVDTHAYLTQKSLEIFNKAYKNNQIPQTLTSFLIDGSRREDDPPRPMNHFYDPIKNRGLSQDLAIDPLPIIGSWKKSKEWAQNNIAQNSLVYSPVIATILSTLDAGKIQKYHQTSDYTWEAALGYWICGEKEMALFTLGHIIHLMQDTSVPDHTRNDPHLGDSPYENYTARFTTDAPDYENNQRNILLTSKTLPSLDAYFTELATYSNTNFYSKDTIGIQSGYEKPTLDYFEAEKGFLYAYALHPEKHRLFVTKRMGNFDYIWNEKKSQKLTEESGDFLVMKDYWNMLSKKAIEYSAGVMDLFFKEAEKNKNNPRFVSQKKDFLGQISDTAQSFIQSLFGGAVRKNTQNIPLQTHAPGAGQTVTQNSVAPQQTTPKNTPTSNKIKTSPTISPKLYTSPSQSPKASSVPKTSPTPKPSTTIQPTSKPSPTPAQKICTQINTAPTLSPILIHEVAWMGTTESANHEWIELKNISNQVIQLFGWSLRTADESIHISFPRIAVQPQEYILLERTSDITVPHIPADILYTGTLSNTGEKIYLFDTNCILIDSITETTWKAGNATERRTMERNETTKTWYTASVINGTPKNKNSTPYTSGGGGGGSPPQTPSPSPEISAEPSPTPSPIISPTPSPMTQEIHITELFYNPEGNDEDREWIEIQNTDTVAVDLTNWKLRENETMHRITPYSENKTIQPGAYAIIADNAEKFKNEQYPHYSETLFDSSFSLSNTGESIALFNQDLFIEEVTYSTSTGGNGNGNSIQKNDTVWCEGIPTPGAENLCGNLGGETPQPLTLVYLANLSETPEEERDGQKFSPALTASWNGDLQEGEYYRIEDVTDPQHPIFIMNAENDYVRFLISEVNKRYVIRASATNGEYVSALYQGNILVPGYVEHIEFTNQENPTIRMSYNQYPFIPDLCAINVGENGKKLVVFFLNHDPIADDTIHYIAEDWRMTEEWSNAMKESLAKIKYRKCSGDFYTGPALILKNDPSLCPVNQNFMRAENIGTSSLELYIEKDRTFSPEDYVTMAYYVQVMTSWGGETYYLAAIDKTKYYFSQ